MLAGAPVDGIGLDLTRDGARNLDLLAAAGGIGDRTLVAGVVDGRNVWVNDLERSLSTLATLLGLAGEVVVSTSCSLQHVPIDLDAEQALDPEIRPWLAFARQKVAEVVTLARGLAEGTGAIAEELEANQRTLAGRRRSGRTHDPAVRRRLDAIGEPELRRASPYEVREKAQRARLGLPPLPTTTIGSFPQTGEVRKARAARRRGELDEAGYQARMRDEIAEVIRIQDELELDVLVHGEPERNDMVQYFGEQLDGVAVTELGWVQSYGTRYVRPPVIFGDVARPAPMTVEWLTYAQSRTRRPVKGMLTGPVTMLKWSFERDDQPGRRPRASSPWPSGTRWPTWRRPGSASSRSTSRPCARPCPFAATAATPTWPGRWRRSGWPPPGSATRPRSTPTCATRSSARSCPRSTGWTPT